MTSVEGKTFGLIGALAAFPRRLAAREVERQHGYLRRGVTRQTSHVVFGRKLLARESENDIKVRFEAERMAGRQLISENGFLRLLGLLDMPEASAMTQESLLEQSKLSELDFSLLSLFDAFEHDREPYSFRDLILSKKYAGLIAGGASWGAITRSIHRSSGAVTSLTSLSLEAEGREAIYARLGERLSELDGQLVLPIDTTDDVELDDLFERAEDAEAEGRFDDAAALYEHYLSIDPTDPIAAFNRANCFMATGRLDEAHQAYLLALKLDPGFVEAWFNLANLLKERGQTDSARRHLHKAIALDSDYADAVYNLATLEFEAGYLAEARRWWIRYLELDRSSGWARDAAKGVQYVDLHLSQRNLG